MNWTTATRKQAIALHAQGWTDRQMADHFGIERTRMASYRINVLRLPSNSTRERGFTTACEVCGARVSVKRYRYHMRKIHDAIRMRGGRTRKVNATARLQPLHGRFDSSKALQFLVEHWRVA